ncbi:hypothetical protein FEM08_28800 [Flavobacterium gilvum]|nr:hypothetical protein FEM08_28800 [Flavobacterium gilvum]
MIGPNISKLNTFNPLSNNCSFLHKRFRIIEALEEAIMEPKAM